jgi:hypothetical protein
LHVGTVHVVFKSLISPKQKSGIEELLEAKVKTAIVHNT